MTLLRKFIVFIVLQSALFARPYLKIQQVRALDFPYVKIEVSVAQITPILYLREENFTLYENGWQVKAFQLLNTSKLEEPKNIVLLIDASKSITQKSFLLQKKAVISFIENLKNNDKVSILSFNDKVINNCGYQTNKAILINCINSISRQGRLTVLHDALLESLTIANRLGESRNSIVVFTDGRDEGSIIQLNDIIKKAEKLSIPIFIAGTGNIKQLKPLARLSRLSGGETYHVPRPEDIRKIYLLINQILDNTYLLQYVSQAEHTSDDGKKVNLKVHLRAKNNDGSKFEDQDEYSFYYREHRQNTWWQKIMQDERYLLFVAGLIILLLLLILILVIARKSKVTIALPAKDVNLPQASVSEDDDIIDMSEAINHYTNESVQQLQLSNARTSLREHTIRAEKPRRLPFHIAYLVVKEGQNAGTKYKVKWEKSTLGSSRENTIFIDDRAISLRHARLQKKGNRFWLFDLLSENGTFINGKKLLRPKELNDFDEIELGNTILIFRRSASS